MADWRRDRGEEMRYRFANLSADSVVLDLGGFRGGWAQQIFDRYGCFLHVFEPHPGFAADLTTRFADNPKITVHAVALAAADGWFELSDLGDASSAFRQSGATVRCRAVEAAAYLREQEIDQIAAMKINIEGGEFELLPHLVEAGLMPAIDVVQVQFHRLAEDSPARRDAIGAQLSTTHRRSWCYPFVWEEWVRQ